MRRQCWTAELFDQSVFHRFGCLRKAVSIVPDVDAGRRHLSSKGCLLMEGLTHNQNRGLHFERCLAGKMAAQDWGILGGNLGRIVERSVDGEWVFRPSCICSLTTNAPSRNL